MGLLFLITSDWRLSSLCTLKLIISLIKLPYNGSGSGRSAATRYHHKQKLGRCGRANENELRRYIKRPTTTGIKMGVALVNDGTTDARERMGLLKETKLQARAKKAAPHLRAPTAADILLFQGIRGTCSYVKSKHRHKSCAAPPN